jgi:hypothetical protein
MYTPIRVARLLRGYLGNLGPAALRKNRIDALGEKRLYGRAFLGGNDLEGRLDFRRKMPSNQHAAFA